MGLRFIVGSNGDLFHGDHQRGIVLVMSQQRQDRSLQVSTWLDRAAGDRVEVVVGVGLARASEILEILSQLAQIVLVLLNPQDLA